jgi:hypothetical protein
VRATRPDVPARVDGVTRRALAKRPADRFPSMGAMVAALNACLAERRAAAPEDLDEDTGVIPPPAPAQPAGPRRAKRSPRLSVLALVLAAGVGVIAGLLALQFTGENFPDLVPGAGDGDDGSPQQVPMRAVSDFDPEGGDGEHPETVTRATDGDPSTFWMTETYRDFSTTKAGVGLVLDARRPVALERLVLRTDEPGFTAIVRAGPGVSGPFEDVSEEQEVGRRTTFELDTNGTGYRYYLVWITDLDGSAHLNEVRAA